MIPLLNDTRKPAAKPAASFVDRARVLTAAAHDDIEAAASWTRAGLLMVGIVAAAAGLAIGASLPMERAATSYNLVTYTGDESDITDHDLTRDDCAGFLAKRLARGERAACISAK